MTGKGTSLGDLRKMQAWLWWERSNIKTKMCADDSLFVQNVKRNSIALDEILKEVQAEL